MALRLGVGDVFTVCKGAVDLCSRSIHDGHEPEEVQSIVAEMKLIRTHLKELESQVGDEKAFATARPDIAPVIKRSLEPLHRDMLNMNQVLHECKRRPSVHVVDKVRYMILYKAKLEAFRQKLPAHRESICVIQELINAQSQTERRTSTVKLCELVENQEKQQMKEEEYDRAQKEVMKMFERRHSFVARDRQLSATEMLECLEDDLVAKGVPREQAGQQLLPLTKALNLDPFPTVLSQPTQMPRPMFKLDVFECTSRSGTCTPQNGLENISEVD